MALLQALRIRGASWVVQEPTWPFLKERRRYCHPQGSMTGLAEAGVDATGLQFLRIVS